MLTPSEQTIRVCCRCNQEKSVDDFYRRSDRPGGRHYNCKECESASCKTPNRRSLANQRVAEFRQRLRERDYSEFRRRERKGNLYRNHGITIEEYEAKLISQGGVCAICNLPPTNGRGLKLHVDHDHSTGKIRGLLCNYCNLGLGKFKDNSDLLQRAIEYLTYHKEDTV